MKMTFTQLRIESELNTLMKPVREVVEIEVLSSVMQTIVDLPGLL